MIKHNQLTQTVCLLVCLSVHLCHGPICGLIFKPRVPMEFPWPRDDKPNTILPIFLKLKKKNLKNFPSLPFPLECLAEDGPEASKSWIAFLKSSWQPEWSKFYQLKGQQSYHSLIFKVRSLKKFCFCLRISKSSIFNKVCSSLEYRVMQNLFWKLWFFTFWSA